MAEERSRRSPPSKKSVRGTPPKGMKTVKFNNGCECPIIGLGTYRSQDEDGYRAVKHAIDVGYRHIDTALYYQNEKEIGRALSEKIADGIIQREDMFLTSKLWNTFHRPDLVEPALKETLKDLRTDYVDLYLIHWPTAFQDGWNLSPKDRNGKMQFSNVDYVDTWKAMECLVDKGMAKSIGLSNFNESQMERILSCARIVPVNNQIEVHPYLNQKTLVDFCNSKNITVTAYRPLGGPPSEPSSPIHNSSITAIGEKHGKTPGQIMIKFLIERGIIAIPKSSNPERIESNLNVFDFKLEETDMKILFDLDKGIQGRSITYDVAFDHKDYPFHTK